MQSCFGSAIWVAFHAPIWVAFHAQNRQNLVEVIGEVVIIGLGVVIGLGEDEEDNFGEEAFIG